MWCTKTLLKSLLLIHAIHSVQSYTHQVRKPSALQPKNSSSYRSELRLRHQGARAKFHRLDGIMDRLDQYRLATSKGLVKKRPWDYVKGGRRKDEIYESYDEVEYRGDNEEDKDEDYHSWDNEEEKRSSLEEDDYLDEDEEEVRSGRTFGRDWQAEEPTQAPSHMTDFKWNHFGTRAKVEESRRAQLQIPFFGDGAAHSAMEHIRRISLEGKCNAPKAKVLSVQAEHPNPGKRYMPHCTILFRCSDDTGCCTLPDTKCQPKKQTKVHLYFYTSTLGMPGNRIEKLSFFNHTECGCLKIGSEPTEVDAPESLKQRVSLRHAMSFRENDFRCNCPEEFVAKRHYATKCICDCSNSNIDCINMKKGKEHLSLKDRKCILEDKCGMPSCEYGAYIRNKGRCPKKQEKLDAYANVSSGVSAGVSARNQN